MSRLILSLGCLLLAGGCAKKAEEHAAMHGPPAAQKTAAQLFTGMGGCHHPIQTSSPEAQKYFDQGLCLLYGFNHDEAIRSFEQASKLDPRAAMPYWGVALALGPNINLDVDPEREKAAWTAVQKAVALSEGAPEAERDYVLALAKRYSNDPKADLHKLAVEYKDAMAAYVRKHPDDLDAAALYAESLMDLRPWRLWDAEGKAAPGTDEIVAVLEGVLRRDPNHVGANHYYIHAVEASRSPERALASADRLKTLAPEAGHLVHMPGHIYLQLGDFETTARQNEIAAAADRKYIQATGASGVYPLMYYTHNLHFIAVARAAQGRYLDAKQAAEQMSAAAAPGAAAMPMLEGYVVIPDFIEMRFHRWKEVLALPEAPPSQKVIAAIRLFGRASALAALGKVNEAVAAKAQFEQARRAIAADFPWGTTNTMPAVMAVASHSIDARIAAARMNSVEAVEAWKKAVQAADALAYDEPPAWYYPVRESLGGALLKAGQFAEAEAVFREDLRRNPRNGRSLFGLLSAMQARRAGGVELIEKEFQQAWRTAEKPLTPDDL